MKQYDIILADPPWRYSFAPTTSRRVENHYPTMDIHDIMDFEVPAKKNAVLYLWATSPKLKEAMLVIDAWGFKYVTNMVWHKAKFGMGYWARSKHELLLIARRGRFSPPPTDKRIPSVFEAPVDKDFKHSRKPKFIHEYLDDVYPEMSKVELFARDARPGWDVMGVDVDETVWDGEDGEIPKGMSEAFEIIEDEFVDDDDGWVYE